MTNGFFKYLSVYFIVVAVLVFFISFCSILPTSDFVWPLPDYTNISSYFGYRNFPTAGASSYHSGIDIPAPEGTPILAICSGEVTFASWGAGGGYTIVIENNDLKVSYCHVSPIYTVSRYDIVHAGDVISTVGPKNVYGIENNPYKDAFGNPTNGATTGCHLHLAIKKNGVNVNPLDFISVPR